MYNYCIKHEDFSCYVFYITTTDRVVKITQYWKGLYDFYYTLVTLTTGYKYFSLKA